MNLTLSPRTARNLLSMRSFLFAPEPSRQLARTGAVAPLPSAAAAAGGVGDDALQETRNSCGAAPAGRLSSQYEDKPAPLLRRRRPRGDARAGLRISRREPTCRRLALPVLFVGARRPAQCRPVGGWTRAARRLGDPTDAVLERRHRRAPRRAASPSSSSSGPRLAPRRGGMLWHPTWRPVRRPGGASAATRRRLRLPG
jgi:hypothetical protein